MSDLEPDSKNGQNYYERELLCSIAISLKRIADVMTKKIVMPELTPEQLKSMQEEYNKAGNIIFNKS